MQYELRFAHVSDDDLLRDLASLVTDSRRVESDLVAHIGEVEERRLYARESCPSMFAYCTETLHLSEAEAYLRIGAARAARKHPVLLDMLGDGRLHLSGIAKLVPHLTQENASAVLARAVHRTKRQIEELIAEMAPRPDVPTLVRKLPQSSPLVPEVPVSSAASRILQDAASPESSVSQLRADLQLRPDGVGSGLTSTRSPTIEPLAPARYKIQFTASAELRDKLERLQKLLGTRGGDLANVIDRIVTEELGRLERKRFGMTTAPREEPQKVKGPTTRRIPAAVRRAVYLRDGGRCRYTDDRGRRCSERHRLEYHHRYPYGFGVDPQRGERLPDVPGPQPVPGRARLRPRRDIPTSVVPNRLAERLCVTDKPRPGITTSVEPRELDRPCNRVPGSPTPWPRSP